MCDVSFSDEVVVKVNVEEDIKENLVDIVMLVVLGEFEVEVRISVEFVSKVGVDVICVESKV